METSTLEDNTGEEEGHDTTALVDVTDVDVEDGAMVGADASDGGGGNNVARQEFEQRLHLEIDARVLRRIVLLLVLRCARLCCVDGGMCETGPGSVQTDFIFDYGQTQLALSIGRERHDIRERPHVICNSAQVKQLG